MASSGVRKSAFVMLIVYMAAMSAVEAAEAAVTCSNVVRHLLPCVSYVQNGGQPAAQCCNGVKTLLAQAQTKTDRQNVCRCTKSAIKGIPTTRFNLANAASLPDKCNLHVPYKISPSTDCNKVP
ncbi:non-specific lipid-transfer protein 1-like [Hibiscus syriacus]|uniref:non-specific lipid-transfer protein 1-like n=1 Tax=Hibiscus syriacus TaxID=106335 RepID=UPI001924E85A|nr:non-specific lipid-transfer protein 1-like [Hibiscus syriacus]